MSIRERIAGFLRTVAEWFSPIPVATVEPVDPFCQLAHVLNEDDSEIVELNSITRQEHAKDKISRTFKLYQVRHPSATMEEFNDLDVVKRRELMEAANTTDPEVLLKDINDA
jgi:hypothetical protein